eukprot:9467816-Ditylum_brightwellii.AAC.1
MAQGSMCFPDSSVMSASVSTQRKSQTKLSFFSVLDEGLKDLNLSMRMESQTCCVLGCRASGTVINALQHLRKVLMLFSQLAGT